MNFKVQQSEIKKYVSFLQKTIPNKPSLPILASIHLELKNNLLTLSATDLFFGTKTSLPVTAESEGICVVPGKEFIEIITHSNANELTFEKVNDTLFIKDSHSTAQLQTFDSSEYPDFPTISGITFTLPFSLFEKNYSMTNFSISLDQARPILNSLLVSITSGKPEIVATDGFRLCVVNENVQLDQDITLIIPQKSVSEIVRIGKQLQTKNLTLTYDSEMQQLLCEFSQVSLYIRLIDGSFPPYKKIIPTAFEHEIVIAGEELSQALKKASIFSREASDIITFSLQDNSVYITSQSPTLGSFSHLLEIEKQSNQLPNIEIAFNSKYLLDFFSNVKPDQVWVGINDSLKPVVFKTNSASELQYIVMPFKKNQS